MMKKFLLMLIIMLSMGMITGCFGGNEASVNSANAELKAVNAQLEAVKSELEAKNAELEAASSELEAKNAELEAASSELETKNAELEVVSSELAIVDSDQVNQTVLADSDAEETILEGNGLNNIHVFKLEASRLPIHEVTTLDGIWTVDFIDDERLTQLVIEDNTYTVPIDQENQDATRECDFVAYDEITRKMLLDCDANLVIFDFNNEAFEILDKSVLHIDYSRLKSNPSVVYYCDLQYAEYYCNWTESSESISTNKTVYQYKYTGLVEIGDNITWDVEKKVFCDHNVTIPNVIDYTYDFGGDRLYILTTEKLLYVKDCNSNDSTYNLVEKNIIGIADDWIDTCETFIVDYNKWSLFNGYYVVW